MRGSIRIDRVCSGAAETSLLEGVASEDASFMTGLAIPVDGGRSIRWGRSIDRPGGLLTSPARARMNSQGGGFGRRPCRHGSATISTSNG